MQNWQIALKTKQKLYKKMNMYKLIRIFILLLCTFIMAGCFSLSVKDYNPFDKDEDILPGKDQVEVKYSTSIGTDWATEITLGPEAEYINVGFKYKPKKKTQIGYANQLLNDLDDVISKKTYQQMLNDEDVQMTNLWADVYSFKLNNVPISFRWAYQNKPEEYAVNLLIQRIYWYISMQMVSESKSTTLNTQRSFYSTHDLECINNLKESIHIFPYLTASKLATTTNALEYTEILSRPAVQNKHQTH